MADFSTSCARALFKLGLTAGTEPFGEAEPSLTNNPIWQA